MPERLIRQAAAFRTRSAAVRATASLLMFVTLAAAVLGAAVGLGLAAALFLRRGAETTEALDLLEP